jgi:glycosyltransferase involved in cell wall biosynthesis
MRTKILFVMHELSLGGAERVITNIANNFNKELYDVHFCLFKKKGALVHEINEEITVHDLKATRVLSSSIKYFKFISNLKPKVVFTSITHVNLLTSFLIPIFKIKNDICFFTREVNNPSVRSSYKLTSKIMDFFYRHTITNYNFIIAQSDYMKMDIMSHYNIVEDKIHSIPNPIDISLIKTKILADKNKFFFDKNKKNILAVGGLRKQKGYDKILNIMKYLDESYHLTIIGEGAERSFLEKLIKEFKIESKITLLGTKINPYVFMRDCDILVVSSYYEGFPNVIIEANVCGKFVVANNCPGINTEIIKDHINGIILNFNNYENVADYLNSNFLTIKEKKIPSKLIERYDAKKISTIYHQLIKEYYSI